MKVDIKKILKNASFDAGLDPDNRLAENSETVSAQKPMLLLSRYAQKYAVPCEIAAAFIRTDAAKSLASNDSLLPGASILRDCYGKINYFVAPAFSNGTFESYARILKAYRSSIHILAVSVAEGNNAPFPSALPEGLDLHLIDEANCVSEDNAHMACADEHIQIGIAAGAALHAAKELALRVNDNHARIVVLFPTES